jgi:hypothetical protein
MATRAKPTTAKGRVPMRPTRRPAATAPIRRPRPGQEEQAGLQRAEAAKVLQVLRTKEQPRDEQAGRDEHQKGADRDRTARQQVQAHQGSRYGALDEHEHPVQDDGGPAGQERAEIRPALLAGVEHAVDERAGGGGDGHRAHHIEASGAVQMARWHHGPDGGQPTA